MKGVKRGGVPELLPRGAPDPIRTHGETKSVPVAEVRGGTAGEISFQSLKSELARRQLRLIDAQVYVKNALARSPLFETDPRLETGVAAILRSAAHGTPIEDAELDALVDDACAQGAPGLSRLVEILESQRAGFLTEVEDPAAFLQAADTLLDRIAGSAFARLGGVGQADQTAAMQSILTGSDLLSCGFSSTAVYPAVNFSYGMTNSFTNEPGFPELVRRVDTTGGAVVGVGGAVFDLASTGADMIISIDANPKIKDSLQVFCAVLLAVDRIVEEQGLSDQARAEMVLSWLSRGPTRETMNALARLGLPGRLRDRLDEILQGITEKLAGRSIEALPLPEDLWCRSKEAPQRVKHLTQLALEGRIVMLTGDIADPRVVERANALLEAHGTRAKVVHFSNALDYIADVGGACRNFGALHLTDDALLTTCAGGCLTEPVWDAKPDGFTLVEVLGTPHKPGANAAAKWLGPSGMGQTIHQVAWDTGRHVDDLVRWTCSLIGVEDRYDRPSSVEGYRTLVDQIERDAFATKDQALERLKTYLNDQGRYQAYFGFVEDPLAELDQPLPQSFDEVGRVADAFDAAFWAKPGRKRAMIESMAQRTGLEAGRVEAFHGEIERCRSYEDLRDLELKIRLSTG